MLNKELEENNLCYKGRNYDDIDYGLNVFQNVWNKILTLLMGDNHDLNIPNGVVSIIGSYIDIREFGLNLCYDEGIEFIKQMFLSVNESPSRTIHVYELCALNTKQVELMMQAMHNTIIHEWGKSGPM